MLSPVTTLCVTGRHVFLMSISKKITQTSRFSGHFFFIKTLKSSCLFLIHNLWAIWENSKLLFWFLYSQNFQTKTWIGSLQNIFLLNQFDGLTSGGVLPIRYPRADYHIVCCQLFCAFPTSHLSALVKKMVFVVFISEENLSKAKNRKNWEVLLWRLLRCQISPRRSFSSTKFLHVNLSGCICSL